MMALFSDLLNLLFPPVCTVCKKRLIRGEKYICLSCLSDLPETDFHLLKDNKIEELFAGRFNFCRIASFAYFVKGGSVQTLIHELKYNNNPDLGCYLGELCGSKLQGSTFLNDIDYLVPVPLHPNRMKLRGYNQAEKIAEGIATQTGISVCSGNLKRVVDNTSQTKQSKFDRIVNTEGIFEAENPHLFSGKHLLLIDDVLTTGATSESCVKALIEANEDIKVSIYTFGVVLG
ncbi:ComF family protein [Dysgonomonas sp. 216]|uniref:ComF family protein n=1 Tax=Dysgonomonas sp. 216 TaxID=2302934 RepID=UPI0013D463CC|nr:ComF family protein [Dysgonomonas sp. 216]NDW17730.1 ComF family protein [Dysgonomonas sp. 216]